MGKFCEKCHEPVYAIYDTDINTDALITYYHCSDETDYTSNNDKPEYHCNHKSFTCLTERYLKCKKLNKKLKKIKNG